MVPGVAGGVTLLMVLVLIVWKVKRTKGQTAGNQPESTSSKIKIKREDELNSKQNGQESCESGKAIPQRPTSEGKDGQSRKSTEAKSEKGLQDRL